MECPGCQVLAAYFCPCFFTQFLACLKSSAIYSDQILKEVSYKNPVSVAIKVFEICHIA